MVFPYEIDPTARRVSVAVPVRVVGGDIADTIEAIYRDAAYQYGFDLVWDGRAIESLLLERDDMQQFVALNRRYAHVVGPGREVLLLRRALDLVMARAYALMSRPLCREIHIVQTTLDVERVLSHTAEPIAV